MESDVKIGRKNALGFHAEENSEWLVLNLRRVLVTYLSKCFFSTKAFTKAFSVM